jgi:tetraacyldisaccharide 4'-kinase
VKILRKIAVVFVPVYWVITWVYHQLYNLRLLKSAKFDHPVICVGNLAVGGTGKTPMIEYLITFLSDKYKIAVLSRGYKRKSSGFIIANHDACAEQIGDEPFQIYSKFKNVIVAVDEKRKRGINNLLQLKNKPQIILLDDAFQHRQVTSGLNILLTAYHDLYCNDMMLPTGNLREPKNGANRAEVIVATKCPDNLSATQKQVIEKQLKLQAHQVLFFSSIKYEIAVRNNENFLNISDLKEKEFTLLTGIANPIPLVTFLEQNQMVFEHLGYPDHHFFTTEELELLKTKSLIVTTEKDFVRLQGRLENHRGLYYLPISIQIDLETEFNTIINAYISTYSSTEA